LIDHLFPLNDYRRKLFLFAPSELRVLYILPQITLEDVQLDLLQLLLSSAPHLLSLLQTHHHFLTILMQHHQSILELQDVIELSRPDGIEHIH
jgi:hypothetical protein